MEQTTPTFTTSTDWNDLDHFSPEEVESIIGWYAESHGDGDINLTPFVPFFMRERPGAFKRYRYQTLMNKESQGSGLPTVAVAFLMMNYYVLSHNELGVYYTVICARNWGASRSEVLDAFEFGFINAGPLGGNAMSGRAADLLADWSDGAPRRTQQSPWPAEWQRPGAAVLPSGGPGADFLSRHAPAVGAALAERRRRLADNAGIPRRMLDLMELNAAVLTGAGDEAASVASQLRSAGVPKAEVLEAVLWAFLAVPNFRLDAVARVLDPVLADW